MTLSDDPPTQDSSDVVYLNTKDFASFLKKASHALVMFFDPACIHCQLAKPEFQKAAEEMKSSPEIVFAAVDCSSYPQLCKAAGVERYPTVKYYHFYNKQPPEYYNGGRTKREFVSYLREVLQN